MSDKYNNIESPGNPMSKHNFNIWPGQDISEKTEKNLDYYDKRQRQKLKMKQEEEKQKKKRRRKFWRINKTKQN